MRTSTLRKLPIPFMAVCGLGIGIVGFLMLQSGEDTAHRTVAKKQTTATNLRPRPVADRSAAPKSNRYRQGKPVAKLNRPGGANYRPVKQSGAQNARDRSSDVRIISPDAYVPELKPAEVVARENAAREASKITPEPSVSESVAAADPSPVRRDSDAIKTMTVAATPDENTYSTANPDPSELLSKVLVNEAPESAEPTKPTNETVEISDTADDPGSIVMPPDVDIAGPELADDSTVEDDLSPKQDTAPPMESVVAGELQPEGDALADKIAIRNPKDNKLPVWFIANRHKVQLKPGQQFVYPASEELEVRFARGGKFGADKVVMREGNWNFSVTRQDGWKLTQLN